MRSHEETVKRMYEEYEEKIRALEGEYTEALETSIQKFTTLRGSYDERVKSETEFKMLLKTVMAKKGELEQTVNECQEVILSSRKKIQELLS